MPEASQTLRVALPTPLYQSFDYLAPAALQIEVGMRVRVPFGHRKLVGMVIETAPEVLQQVKLKSIEMLLDEQPLVDTHWLALCRWAARYYHHPAGEVMATALPTALRNGQAAIYRPAKGWTLTEAGLAALHADKALGRAIRQKAVLLALQSADAAVTEERLRAATGAAASVLKALADKGWIEAKAITVETPANASDAPALSSAQTRAVDSVLANTEQFHPCLLEGVTGSGKTEVYLHIAEEQARVNKQTLILVPEIGLTPALIARFETRLGQAPAVLHSGLNDGERLHAWLRAARGDARVVIGTRSAVFTPLPQPGAIIIDEEHDASLKQQDGLRYSARDVAVRRAQMLNIPIMLGSATPSMETLHNALSGRYAHLRLPERVGQAELPRTQVIDLRRQPMFEGMSQTLLQQLDRHMEAGGQALLFLNRRGFAPSLMCHDCGWVADCQRCNVPRTYHRQHARLRCHHCGSDRPLPAQCPECNGDNFMPQGIGTERVEAFLKERYPDIGIVRIDRDTTRRKHALAELLEEVSSQRARILIGTQMLAKGHDFPELSMVGILNTDGGLFSIDFRAPERMAQLITQVAGRAGRGERPGEVFIQTHHPDHPLLLGLLRNGYDQFAQQVLQERELAGYPPNGYLCLIRAESADEKSGLKFLSSVADQARRQRLTGVEIWDAVPAPMERRAGRFRSQLLIQSQDRPAIHALLDELTPQLTNLPLARKVRWSIDVDPQDML